MKRVKISHYGKDAIVVLDWDNVVQQDCPAFKIKKGDDLSVHYRNNKNTHKYENIPVYTKPYHPQEKFDWLMNKNPKLSVLIDKFDLVLSV